MPVDTQRVWLTEQTYDRVRIELALLLAERAAATDREQRELRIRQLQELISNAAVGHEPPDDGVAEPGMVLTVHYEAADLTETFLLADREESTHNEDLPVYSPHSPLGTALTGARPGERREYPIPGGETMTVTLVNAAPYRRQNLPRPHAAPRSDLYLRRARTCSAELSPAAHPDNPGSGIDCDASTSGRPAPARRPGS
jgi:transcription elongation factor GreA